MKFSDIIGHEEIKSELRRMVDTGQVPHAIMLGGPQGSGKLRLARAFVQYLQCRNRIDGDSCGKCPSCLQHQSINNPDLSYVYPVVKNAKQKLEISADYADRWREYMDTNPYNSPEEWNEAMRAENSQPGIFVAESNEIIRKMSMSAYSGEYKAMIIWQPEKMNIETSNKLLKIIEEPYPGTLFVLVSNEPQTVLPTIYSRTRPLNVSRLSDDEVAQCLVREGVAPETAADAARLSEGNVNRALQIGRDAAEPKEFMTAFQDMMRQCYAMNAAALKTLSEAMAEWGREKQRRFLRYCTRMIRENFIYNLHTPALNLQTAAEEAFSTRFAPFIHEGNVEEMASATDTAAADILRNANSKIVLFDWMLTMMQLIRRKKQ